MTTRGFSLAVAAMTSVVVLSSALTARTISPTSHGVAGRAAQRSVLKVSLLGTGGGPTVNLQRFGPSTLVEFAGERLLFDCGRGTTLRMAALGVPAGAVTKLFLTHLHSDHIVDIPDLFLSPWGAGARRVPLEVWGPSGTVSMMDALRTAFDFDLRVRVNQQNRIGAEISSRDIQQGIVFDRDGIRVTAFLVDHGPVSPAFGFRVDAGGRSVALSGDTRFSENLIRFSKGVDVLVHEAADEEALQRLPPEQRAAIMAIHTTAERAGEVFAQVKPRLAVYSHAGESQKILARTRTTYSGPLESGDDLMTIEIGDQIDVRRAQR